MVSAAMAEVAISINPPAIKLMEGSFMWSSFCSSTKEGQRPHAASVPSPRLTVSGVLQVVEAHLAVALGVLAPALAHFDEQKEMHGCADHLADLLARRYGDFLDGCAGCAKYDFLLAVAHDIDCLLDAHAAV